VRAAAPALPADRAAAHRGRGSAADAAPHRDLTGLLTDLTAVSSISPDRITPSAPRLDITP
jgi:hypothetical protein